MSRVIHFEIPANDPQKTVDFFTNVFGWTFTRWGEEAYWLASTGDNSTPGINGAIIKRRAPDMPVVNTIGVADIDKAISSVESNGGLIVVPKTTIPNMGHLCYFKDPDGVIHGMMQEDPNAK
ncbi:MAG: VOC family protein [Chitinophagales bacterium]